MQARRAEIPGLVIWAHSKCRSTHALYREVSRLIPVRLVSREGIRVHRCAQGVCEAEFQGLPYQVLGEDIARANEILGETHGWVHLVAAYQVSPMMRHVISVAKERGDRVAVISEAPWNAQQGWRRAVWEVYLRTFLRWRMRQSIRQADCLVNYSGDRAETALSLGWRRDRIIPFGYFPAPLDIPKEDRRGRSPRRLKAFVPATLGRTGRGEATVRSALSGLGDLVELDMPGFLAEAELHRHYQEADFLIAAGGNEPWGIRVNDALNCGMPVLVSSGMGACKIVRETGAGLVFRKGDPKSLQSVVQELICNYDRLAGQSFAAAGKISPKVKALELLGRLSLLEEGR